MECRERALQAIRNDCLICCSTWCLIDWVFKMRQHERGPGASHCVCRRIQLAGGNMVRGRYEFGFHFCQICPASVGGFLAANWCQIESKMLRSSVSVFSDKRTYTSLHDVVLKLTEKRQNTHLYSTDKSLEFVLKNLYQKLASQQQKKDGSINPPSHQIIQFFLVFRQSLYRFHLIMS